MAFFIELERKKEELLYKKISIFMKLVEKYSTKLSIDDQNSFWNTEKHKII